MNNEIATTQTTKEIEKYLNEEKKLYLQLKNEPKLLLLGSSDSGKSTLLKQLKILHGKGFTENEISFSRTRIRQEIFKSANMIMSKLANSTYHHIPKRFNEYLGKCDRWMQGESDCISVDEILGGFALFWQQELVKEVVSNGDLGLTDNYQYFIDHISRIMANDYIPNNQDILNLRTVTKNVSDSILELKRPNGGGSDNLHVIDVSGLSHHRGRWVSYFDDVRCVCFVASLACYDQSMAEEVEVNRMVDSLVLFEEMVNHPLLEKKEFVLLLNKKDVYERKIKLKHIVDYFPQYHGKKGSASAGITYFDLKFRDRQKIDKVITTHVSTCNSTDLMKVVVDALIQGFINEAADMAGI